MYYFPYPYGMRDRVETPRTDRNRSRGSRRSSSPRRPARGGWTDARPMAPQPRPTHHGPFFGRSRGDPSRRGDSSRVGVATPPESPPPPTAAAGVGAPAMPPRMEFPAEEPLGSPSLVPSTALACAPRRALSKLAFALLDYK